MSKLQILDKAPDFSALDSYGNQVSLKDFAGKFVVIYFYPKDDTPGCTVEANDFKDNYKNFVDLNTVIIGVSKDSCKRHVKFTEKYELPFILLSDEDLQICKDYKIWVEKSMYGKKYMGIERSTFLIDPQGVVKKSWHKVKVKNHVNEVLQVVKDAS
jgi:peroxiredoxin Q/BCP